MQKSRSSVGLLIAVNSDQRTLVGPGPVIAGAVALVQWLASNDGDGTNIEDDFDEWVQSQEVRHSLY